MSNRAARIVVTAAAGLLGAAGIALLSIGLIGSETLASIAARYSPDHSISAAFLHDVVRRGGICGAAVLLIAIALFLTRDAFAEALRTLPRPALPRMPLAALVILAIGIVARALLLDRPLHWDEAYTFHEFVPRPALDFLSRYAHPNNHILHTLVAHIVYALGGTTRWILRLPAFAAGIGVLIAIYVVARRLRGENAALLALALAAGASPLVEYSAQGRGYSILTLCVLALFAIPIDDDRWLPAALLAAAGAWTIPVMLFPFATWLVWLLLQRVPIRRIAAIAATTAALAFLLYVPVLIVSGPRSITNNGTVKPQGIADVVRALPRSLAKTGRDWTASFPVGLQVILGAGVLASIARSRHPDGSLALAILLATLPLLLLLRVVPFPRVWVPFLPLFLILAASGLTSERWPRAATSAVALLVSAFLGWSAIQATERVTFFEDQAMGDVPAVAAFLRSELPRDTAVLVMQPLDQSLAFELNDPRLVRMGFDMDAAAVRAALETRPHAWVILSPGTDPARELGLTPGRLVRRIGLARVSELR
jgi:dolichyl-phosphate-mannose-protein mannosyltransferase